MSKKYDILVVGMDKITDKSTYLYDVLADRGISTLLYSTDKTGFYDPVNKKYKTTIKIAPGNVLVEILVFLKLLFTVKPKHVEFYRCRPIQQFLYTFFCFIFRKEVSVVCIGELYYWEKYNALRRWIDKRMFRYAHLLITTELYMDEYLTKYNIASTDKTVFCHNRIPVSPDYNVERQGKKVLFINSYKPWRRLELLIKAAPMIKARVPEFEINFVGSTMGMGYMQHTLGYEQDLRDLAKDLGVEKNINFLPFTSDAKSFMEETSVFCLPADLVFCNFSLIEAMERGVPAVVAGLDEGAHQIVTDGIDGYVVDQVPEQFADRIATLLENEEKRQRMGEAARKKVLDKFDVTLTKEILYEGYKKFLWK